MKIYVTKHLSEEALAWMKGACPGRDAEPGAPHDLTMNIGSKSFASRVHKIKPGEYYCIFCFSPLPK